MASTIFITGATSGFGLATATLFSQHGWRVAATYHRAEAATPLTQLANTTAYELDIANPAQVEEVMGRVLEEFGVPDVIVNNAGYCLIGSLEASSMEQIERQFDVNFFGTVRVIKALLPQLRQKGRGMLINIASSSALTNYAFVPVYGASKAAVRGLSEALFIELAPFGIKVKTIFPGLHSTKIFTKLDSATGPGHEAYAPFFRNFARIQSYSGKAGAPQQVADAIWKMVQQNDDRLEYPINRDAKLLVKMKRFMSDKVWKKMNAGMIINKPTQALLRMMKWQINGTKTLEFEPSPKLSESTPGPRA
jgi:NAD(P)-dependent dehydrogenase (short-subunit alcohol dehydrogenase family)